MRTSLVLLALVVCAQCASASRLFLKRGEFAAGAHHATRALASAGGECLAVRAAPSSSCTYTLVSSRWTKPTLGPDAASQPTDPQPPLPLPLLLQATAPTARAWDMVPTARAVSPVSVRAAEGVRRLGMVVAAAAALQLLLPMNEFLPTSPHPSLACPFTKRR